mmetsp:Transcript_22580/g.55913  ORF Transcript_22580/g.55913 Transcript_22580/m.55913 type:complete len:210 (-) Transcript_22580:598-1227(-)
MALRLAGGNPAATTSPSTRRVTWAPSHSISSARQPARRGAASRPRQGPAAASSPEPEGPVPFTTPLPMPPTPPVAGVKTPMPVTGAAEAEAPREGLAPATHAPATAEGDIQCAARPESLSYTCARKTYDCSPPVAERGHVKAPGWSAPRPTAARSTVDTGPPPPLAGWEAATPEGATTAENGAAPEPAAPHAVAADQHSLGVAAGQAAA